MRGIASRWTPAPVTIWAGNKPSQRQCHANTLAYVNSVISNGFIQAFPFSLPADNLIFCGNFGTCYLLICSSSFFFLCESIWKEAKAGWNRPKNTLLANDLKHLQNAYEDISPDDFEKFIHQKSDFLIIGTLFTMPWSLHPEPEAIFELAFKPCILIGAFIAR